jgi:hypothetical protein
MVNHRPTKTSIGRKSLTIAALIRGRSERKMSRERLITICSWLPRLIKFSSDPFLWSRMPPALPVKFPGPALFLASRLFLPVSVAGYATRPVSSPVSLAALFAFFVTALAVPEAC